jgi:hypothetical protein
MGNERRDVGEVAGWLVLAAMTSYGRGRLVVLGDTTPFQDDIIPRTFPDAMSFVTMVVVADEAICRGVDKNCLALAFAVIAIAFYILGWRNCSTLVLGIALGSALASIQFADPSAAAMSGGAAVDEGHGNRILWTGKGDLRITELISALHSRGIPAVSVDRLTRASTAQRDFVMIIAPRIDYTASELDVLTDYLGSGGTVCVFVGVQEAAACPNLLAWCNIKLTGMPLGSSHGKLLRGFDSLLAFNSAWAIEPCGATVVADVEAVPVVVSRSVGRGHCVVVGDPQFWSSRERGTVNSAAALMDAIIAIRGHQ